ncbi:MAG: hypothetical protein LBQ27_03445, partial [Clostridiales bacterium]|nr:hypothetical protein [Clostridiales bacterium]
MWTRAISIDKRYAREFNYIVGEVSKSKYSTYAVEEGKKRYFVHVIGEDENGETLSASIKKIVTDVILVYFKSRYIKSRLVYGRGYEDDELSDSMAVLVSALIYFDVGIEREIIRGVVDASCEYAVDGMFT